MVDRFLHLLLHVKECYTHFSHAQQLTGAGYLLL